MRVITGILTKELENHVKTQSVAKCDAYPVRDFRELVEHVARLSYLNKDYLLFFRGQEHDYKNKAGASTIYPRIYRGEYVRRDQLELSFSVLESASSRLCDALRDNQIDSYKDVKRRQYIQWSILQHYEVCFTPLLDITQSLRVACSFAYLSGEESEPYIIVLGLPYFTNRISINSEHDIVNVRLLSICPPEALRPYFQEGYVAGTDEVTMDYDSKTELDFNNRLIAKFRLVGNKKLFWIKGFQPYSNDVLYPPDDRFQDICNSIRTEIDTGPTPGRIGAFLEQWTELESWIMEIARSAVKDEKVYSTRNAIDVLQHREVLDPSTVEQLDSLRRTRNEVVHRPKKVSIADVVVATNEMRSILQDLKIIKRVSNNSMNQKQMQSYW